MRWNKLPSLVFWPLVFAVSCHVAGALAAAAAGPTLTWLGAALGGMLAAVLARRYYQGHGLAIVRWWEQADRIRFPAIALTVLLYCVPLALWLGWVGVRTEPLPMTISKAAAAVLLTVTAPLFEEVAFRGVVLYGMLAAGSPPWVALTVQSALFDLFHGDFAVAALCFRSLAGLLFGLVAWRCASIWPALVLHVSINLAEQGRFLASGALAPGASVAEGWQAIAPTFAGVGLALLGAGRIAPRCGVGG